MYFGNLVQWLLQQWARREIYVCKTYKLLELIKWISLGVSKLNLTWTAYRKRYQWKLHITHSLLCFSFVWSLESWFSIYGELRAPLGPGADGNQSTAELCGDLSTSRDAEREVALISKELLASERDRWEKRTQRSKDHFNGVIDWRGFCFCPDKQNLCCYCWYLAEENNKLSRTDSAEFSKALTSREKLHFKKWPSRPKWLFSSLITTILLFCGTFHSKNPKSPCKEILLLCYFIPIWQVNLL